MNRWCVILIGFLFLTGCTMHGRVSWQAGPNYEFDKVEHQITVDYSQEIELLYQKLKNFMENGRWDYEKKR